MARRKPEPAAVPEPTAPASPPTRGRRRGNVGVVDERAKWATLDERARNLRIKSKGLRMFNLRMTPADYEQILDLAERFDEPVLANVIRSCMRAGIREVQQWGTLSPNGERPFANGEIEHRAAAIQDPTGRRLVPVNPPFRQPPPDALDPNRVRASLVPQRPVMAAIPPRGGVFTDEVVEPIFGAPPKPSRAYLPSAPPPSTLPTESNAYEEVGDPVDDFPGAELKPLLPIVPIADLTPRIDGGEEESTEWTEVGETPETVVAAS